MSIQYQPTPFQQKVTILNDDKFRLYGSQPVEGNQNGRVPTLHVDTKGNNPRLMVRLNNGKKGDEGRIEMNLDLPTFTALLVMMEDAIRAKQTMSQAIQVKKAGWDRQANKPRDPYLYATIHIGKDADGLEFIGIQQKNTKLGFYFTEPEFHPIVDTATGQQATRQQISSILARAWVKMMTILVPVVTSHVWDYEATPEAKRAKRQQQNGGNNGGNGNGYNNNNSYSQNHGYNANQQNNYQQQSQQQYSAPQQQQQQAEPQFDDNFENVPF